MARTEKSDPKNPVLPSPEPANLAPPAPEAPAQPPAPAVELKRLKNIRNAPWNGNVPGVKGGVHLAPKGKDGSISEPFEVHGEHGLGPEAEAAIVARHIAVVTE